MNPPWAKSSKYEPWHWEYKLLTGKYYDDTWTGGNFSDGASSGEASSSTHQDDHQDDDEDADQGHHQGHDHGDPNARTVDAPERPHARSFAHSWLLTLSSSAHRLSADQHHLLWHEPRRLHAVN